MGGGPNNSIILFNIPFKCELLCLCKAPSLELSSRVGFLVFLQGSSNLGILIDIGGYHMDSITGPYGYNTM